jgi:hypothetical protein
LKIQTPPTDGKAEEGDVGWDRVPIGSLLCMEEVVDVLERFAKKGVEESFGCIDQLMVCFA